MTCSECKYRVSEGGDPVPYGSTTTYTPEWHYCVHPTIEGLPEDEYDAWNEEYVDEDKPCEYWEGN